MLRWAHRRGGQAHCLLQLRRADADADADADEDEAETETETDVLVVVASELRDNPRGVGLSVDVPDWAGAVLEQVLPRSVAPERIRWWVRHGWYFTYDPAGPGRRH